MAQPPIFWIVFGIVVLGMTALDLGVLHRKTHAVSFREAFTLTFIWVALACGFGGWIWFSQGAQKGLEFYTGYLIELSLSADNVFIFALIFSSFAVPAAYQHKVLVWGVLSALVMRFVMIGVGVALIHQFSWIIYVFGGFLILTGAKMLMQKDSHPDPGANPVVRWCQRVLPITSGWEGDKFTLIKEGKRWFTPLFVVLICIEISDLIFAVDSIPAIFGVTDDFFIIFTSNVFAIMGLRSLYFVLSGVIEKFHLLKYGLGIILCFVGTKMVLMHTDFKISTPWALGFTVAVLVLSVVGSVLFPAKKENIPQH